MSHDKLTSRHVILIFQLKFLLVGFGLCICSFGFSMIPVVCFSKRTRLKLKKLIELENHRIYRKLGLEWKLGNCLYDIQPFHINHTVVHAISWPICNTRYVYLIHIQGFKSIFLFYMGPCQRAGTM